MGSKGYRMLAYEGLEKSYLAQVSCYMAGLNLQEAIVLCKCKDTSDLTELLVRRDDALVAESLEKFDKVIASGTPDMVQRMYGPKEDGTLPWQCNYCAQVLNCWKDYDPKQVKANVYKLSGNYKEA